MEDKPTASTPPAHQQAAEMAVLAQCKFNETRMQLKQNKNNHRGHAGAGTKHKKKSPYDNTPDDKSQQLLSTLLYLSTMLDKVEGMKDMLQSHNPSLYLEWKPLFDALHPPATVLKEQSEQDESIKRLTKRRDHYKDEVARSKTEIDSIQDAARASESQLKDTISTMSASLANLEGRLMEKEDIIKNMGETHAAESKASDALRHELHQTQGHMRDAQSEMRAKEVEWEAKIREKDATIEKLRAENDDKCKSLEGLQEEIGKVSGEMEKALRGKDDEIALIRRQLETSDRRQEELLVLLQRQQEQQQQQQQEQERREQLHQSAPQLHQSEDEYEGAGTDESVDGDGDMSKGSPADTSSSEDAEDAADVTAAELAVEEEETTAADSQEAVEEASVASTIATFDTVAAANQSLLEEPKMENEEEEEEEEDEDGIVEETSHTEGVDLDQELPLVEDAVATNDINEHSAEEETNVEEDETEESKGASPSDKIKESISTYLGPGEVGANEGAINDVVEEVMASEANTEAPLPVGGELSDDKNKDGGGAAASIDQEEEESAPETNIDESGPEFNSEDDETTADTTVVVAKETVDKACDEAVESQAM